MATTTVVVLAYNRPKLLAEALVSVEGQTRAPDEVLVIDDHSSPALTAARARVIRQPSNQGPAAAAAIGLTEATGDLVAFLNDDDVWAPDFLAALTQALEERPDATMAFCDHGVIGGNGEIQDEVADALSTRYRRDTLTDGIVADFPRAAIVDRSVAASSFALARREELSADLLRAGGDAWDYFLAVGVALSGRSAVYVDRRLGWYRLSPGGVTAQWDKPEPRIAFTARIVAATRLALVSPETRGIRWLVVRGTLRQALATAALPVRRREPGLAALVGREFAAALASPLAPPRR